MHVLLFCVQISNDLEMLAKMPPARNCPRLVELTVMDGTSVYYVFMERAVICSVKSFTKALFLWFALHYNYMQSRIREVCGGGGIFFQEFVFGLPCPITKTATYLATTTDIQKLTLK